MALRTVQDLGLKQAPVLNKILVLNLVLKGEVTAMAEEPNKGLKFYKQVNVPLIRRYALKWALLAS